MSTTKQTKQANYTPEAVAILSSRYSAGESVDAIAASMGRTVASVRAKLASLGLYKTKAKPEGKKGGVTKAQVVSDIAAIVAGDKNGLESLTAATMADLNKILAFLVAEMREAAGLDESQPEGEAQA